MNDMATPPRRFAQTAEERPGARAARSPVRRRYRYRRRHTPHFYIVVTALSGAAVVCVLNVIAYRSQSVEISNFAFAAVGVTTLVVFAAYFWGIFMLMSGRIPIRRLKVLVPHAAVGVLSPLLYTLNISADLDGLGTQPIGGLGVACGLCSFCLLCLQFAMGRAVVRTEPLRLLAGRATASLDKQP
jgi:hypothetical protein